jgi:phosphoglycerate dehydrogenase-like enzyme
MERQENPLTSGGELVDNRPLIIYTETLDDEPARWLSQHGRVQHVAHDAPDFFTAAADAAALIIRTHTVITADLLAHLPHLRVIGRAGTGLDNIDLPACAARNVAVVHTPLANVQAVVEYVFALMFDALRPRSALDRAVDLAQWKHLRRTVVGSRQIADLTLGILGLGRIGTRVAEVARAIGCEVIYNDLLDIDSARHHGAQPVAVDDLFERSDVLTLHIDGRPSNRNFVNGALLGRMKDDVVFINACRGFVLDHVAMGEFLAAHPAAQAHLDVHEPEPFEASHPLLSLPNAYLYPHMASRTGTALLNMSWVVKDVWAVLDGREPQHPAPMLGM